MATTGTTLRLSKSKYVTGLQCSKLLWWTVHEPDAPELVPDPATQARFDTGHEVGAVARAYVPGGVLLDGPGRDLPARLEATREALARGASVLYEAAFQHADVLVLADILERRNGAWILTEVKSTTKVKDQHLPDAAVQAWVLRNSGLPVERVELMHLNRECRHPDLSNLFVRRDLTPSIGPELARVPGEVGRQLEVLRGPCPEVAVGEHCDRPYTCAFRERCWGAPAAADPSVPPTVRPGLREAVGSLRPPIAYLDYETIMPAIPVWRGMRPYDTTPVQVSVHREEADGTVTHHEWLAEPGRDPREDAARWTLEFTRDARTVVAYNAPYERRILEDLAWTCPRSRSELLAVAGRLWDLLPVVRNHVDHPGFGGSYSLKKVLPMLVPDLAYDILAIRDGDAASTALARLLLRPHEIPPEDRPPLRRDLLAYGRLDTMAMVRVVERLRELA